MALTPQALGKVFKKLNTGETAFKDLNQDVKRQIARTRNTAIPGTQAHTYWQNINQRRANLNRPAPATPTVAELDDDFRGHVTTLRNAVQNVQSGLRQNFKDADDDIINSQAQKIVNSMDDWQLNFVGSKNGTFGQMVKNDIGDSATNIHSYVTSATGAKGWLGGSATHHNNFDDLLSKTKAQQKEVMSELNQRAQASDSARYAEDRIRKMEYDNKQSTKGYLRSEGFSDKAIDRTLDRVEQDAGGFVPKDYDAAVDTLYRRRGEAIAGEGASESKINRAANKARRQSEANGERRSPTGDGQDSSASTGGVVDRYMQRRYGMMMKDISSALNSGNKLSSDTINTFAKQTRLNDEVSEQFKNLVEGGKNAEAISLLKSQQRDYMSSANIIDKALAHKIPQKGAVVVGGAWLVNNMSASRGQQSNSQLYGQQTPYM